MNEVRPNKHSGVPLSVPPRLVPKHRRKVIIRQVCEERGAPITEPETMPGHVHLLVECDPQYGIHRLVKQTKGRSSPLPLQEFPRLKSRMPTQWTNSHFAATVGGATLEIVKQHVANQRNVQWALPPHG